MKPSQIYWLGEEIEKNAIPTTTKREAPVFIPKILGSAIGFRVIDCIRQPDTPKEAPAKIPNKVRGILAWTTLIEKLSLLVNNASKLTM